MHCPVQDHCPVLRQFFQYDHLFFGQVCDSILHLTLFDFQDAAGDLARILEAEKTGRYEPPEGPRGEWLAELAGTQDSQFEQSGNLLIELSVPTKNWVWSVVFTPDGQYLLSSGDDATIKLWDLRANKCVEILRGHTSSVRSIAISKDGKFLASGSSDHQVKLWDLEKSCCIKTLVGHSNWVWSVAFSPGGNQLASGSSDHTVRIWEVFSGQCLHLLQGHSHKVRSVAFNPINGQFLASGSEDGTIKLWNLDTTECLNTMRPPRPYERMNIMGITGLTVAQKDSLKLLGAVEVEKAL